VTTQQQPSVRLVAVAKKPPLKRKTKAPLSAAELTQRQLDTARAGDARSDAKRKLFLQTVQPHSGPLPDYDEKQKKKCSSYIAFTQGMIETVRKKIDREGSSLVPGGRVFLSVAVAFVSELQSACAARFQGIQPMHDWSSLYSTLVKEFVAKKMDEVLTPEQIKERKLEKKSKIERDKRVKRIKRLEVV
jgi:hypothetical protein